MVGFARRWWPVPAVIALSLVAQAVAYTNRYEVGGHAAEHLGSGAFLFLASAVAILLVWSTPSIRRSVVVLAGLAVWLGAGVAVLVGNVRVVDALIRSGQSHTGTEAVIESAAIEDAHWLANNAPYACVVGALVVIVGLYRAGAISHRMTVVTGILSVLFPPWILPGVGVVIATIARFIARERDARQRAEEVLA